METELTENLLGLVRVYCMETGLARSTIGMRVARDARFFDRLANGKGFTVKTYDAVVRWFSANWPAKAEWPCDVLRPHPVATVPPSELASAP